MQPIALALQYWQKKRKRKKHMIPDGFGLPHLSALYVGGKACELNRYTKACPVLLSNLYEYCSRLLCKPVFDRKSGIMKGRLPRLIWMAAKAGRA